MMTAMSPRRTALSLLAPMAALALAACGSGGDVPLSAGRPVPSSSAPPAVVVTLRYDSIEPSHVTITAGQTVEWRWQEAPIPANVTFADFASPTMVSGTWSHTFAVPGTYAYQDTLNQQATGVVIVLP
jgi:plastocyanin